MTETEARYLTAPVTGVFTGVGEAERAIHDLQGAGFSRDAVAMTIDAPIAETSQPQAPPSYSTLYAVLGSILGGIVMAIISTHAMPKTVSIAGFGWHPSSVVFFSLAGGLFGWLMGGIVGFGDFHANEDEDEVVEPPVAYAARTPIVRVAVEAPNRPEEARTILRIAGAYDLQGGDVVVPDLSGRNVTHAQSHAAHNGGSIIGAVMRLFRRRR